MHYGIIEGALRPGLVLTGAATALALAMLIIWFVTPAIVAGQIESALLDSGFEVASAEMEGYGWRQVKARRISAHSGNSRLNVRNATLHYTLAGLLRRNARALMIDHLEIAYDMGEWPEWERLQNEFPFPRLQRDPDDPPFTEKIRVARGRVILRTDYAELLFITKLQMEKTDPHEWRAHIEISGAGVGLDGYFETSGANGKGFFDIQHCEIDLLELWLTIQGLNGTEIPDGWTVPPGPLKVDGEANWENRHLSWRIHR